MARIMVCAIIILLLTDSGSEAQAPPRTASEEKSAAAKPLTSRTYKVRIAVTRDTLERMMEFISAKIGVPIVIEKGDLQLEGITKGQSYGLNESNLTVEELIRKYLLICNSGDKLAYVVRTDPQGTVTVHIVTRNGAAKRGEKLFSEFDVQPPKPKPEIPADAGPWSNNIQAGTLEEEVRRQIEALSEATHSRAPEKPTRLALAQLAILFRVIDEYDGEVRWKREAHRVSADLENSLPPRDAWNELHHRTASGLNTDFERLIKTNEWPRTEKIPHPLTWEKIGPRPQVMQRIEQIYQQRLATWPGPVTDQPARTQLQHQAEVIATLARVLQASSYEYAEEQEYIDSAKSLEQQAKAIATAAAEKADNSTIKLQIQRMAKCCSDCHENYR